VSKIRINLYKKNGPLDIVGWMLGVQQRSAITHANIQIDDEVWTTGAQFHLLKGWIFGNAPAEKYNKGRQYYQAEFVEPLTLDQEEVLLIILKGLVGQGYGFGKVFKLAFAGNTRAEFICELGPVDLQVRNPFCSESVVYSCWKIGEMICQWLCRKEPSVCSPHDIYLEAIRGIILKISGGVGVDI
jgi:hypothetical protein